MNKGRYIVLEGPEGVGKTTQLHELARRLRAAGFPVRVLREPDSQSDLTARAIRQLTQDPQYPMNTRTEVLLYNAARSQSLQVIKQSVENGIICLVDRNYLTTLAIQYYGRGDVPDYNTINGIINFAVDGLEPDLCMVLDAPVATLRQRLEHRKAGERFDNLDDAFLERVRAGYLWEARQRSLQVVFATEDAATIADNIWKLVADNLSVRDSKTPTAAGPVSVGEVIEQKKLQESEEPAPNEPPINPELITVKPTSQTAGKQLAVSSLLAAYIESNRLPGPRSQSAANYQPTQDETEYTYYTPPGLKPVVEEQYAKAIGTIFDIYSTMTNKLAEHLLNISNTPNDKRDEAWHNSILESARSATSQVLPLATMSKVDLSWHNNRAKNSLITLLSDGLSEAQGIAESFLSDINLTKDSIGESEDISATAAYKASTYKSIQKLADELLPSNNAAPSQAVILVDYWPKNELLIVPDMLYEHSSLPLEQLQSIVNDWPYDQKASAFKSYMGDRKSPQQYPGRALEKPHYSWDILCSFNSFRQLQQHKPVDDFNWQSFTPRYGYEVPDILEEAGLTEQFEACFDISLKLYSLLQKEGHALEAQYAVLMGHKLRCKVTYNAREAFLMHELEDTGSLPLDYQELVGAMHEKLAEVHPLLAESMIFA